MNSKKKIIECPFREARISANAVLVHFKQKDERLFTPDPDDENNDIEVFNGTEFLYIITCGHKSEITNLTKQLKTINKLPKKHLPNEYTKQDENLLLNKLSSLQKKWPKIVSHLKKKYSHDKEKQKCILAAKTAFKNKLNPQLKTILKRRQTNPCIIS